MVEWDGLENRCTGNRTVGSNPTLSVLISLIFMALLEISRFDPQTDPIPDRVVGRRRPRAGGYPQDRPGRLTPRHLWRRGNGVVFKT